MKKDKNKLFQLAVIKGISNYGKYNKIIMLDLIYIELNLYLYLNLSNFIKILFVYFKYHNAE